MTGGNSENDRRELEDLVEIRRYLERVIRRAYNNWVPSEVDDLVQACVVRIMNRTERDPSKTSFSRAYLGKVACSHVIDEIRKRRPVVSVEDLKDDGRELPSSSNGPDTAYTAGVIRRAIDACFAMLPENRKRAVKLMLMGHTNKEIASLLGWDEKKAENNVTRGRVQLRKCLRSKGISA